MKKIIASTYQIFLFFKTNEYFFTPVDGHFGRTLIVIQRYMIPQHTLLKHTPTPPPAPPLTTITTTTTTTQNLALSIKNNLNEDMIIVVEPGGTRLIQTPRGHAIVSVLSRCPY